MEGLKEGIEAACVSWLCSRREDWYIWVRTLSLPEIEAWESVAPRMVRILYRNLAARGHARWENHAHTMACCKQNWARDQWSRIVLLAAGKDRAIEEIRNLSGKFEVMYWQEPAYQLSKMYPEETWLSEVLEEAAEGWHKYCDIAKERRRQ